MVLPRVSARSPAELARVVAELMSEPAGLDRQHVETAFLDALRGDGFSMGNGVAIPHTEVETLTETVVCLVTLEHPLSIRTTDGRAPDVFLFILSKPDPHAHLLLLAHLARLLQSRTFVEGVRRARTADEVVTLVEAAELRYRALRGLSHSGEESREQSVAPPPMRSPAANALFVIALGGEKLVDALLIDLVDQGFGEASVLEAQSLREAAAREVPLFARFRDLFGDPGGRRILLLEAPTESEEAIIEAVRRVCVDHGARDAHVSVLPVATSWSLPRSAEDDAPGGH